MYGGVVRHFRKGSQMARVLLAFAFLTSMWSMPQGVSAQDESTCTATPDSPLSISAEAGQVARVTCVDGSFQVAYRSLTESDAVLTEDPSWVQESLATQAENRVMDSGTICRGISKAVDNRIATLDMTWYQVSLLSWHDGSWVNSVGGAWGNYYYISRHDGMVVQLLRSIPVQLLWPVCSSRGLGEFRPFDLWHPRTPHGHHVRPAVWLLS